MAKKVAAVKASKTKSPGKPKPKKKAAAKATPKKATKKKPASPKKRAATKRRAPPVAARPRDALTSKLLEAIDHMQDIAPGVNATVSDAPQNIHSRTPWRMLARFHFPGQSTYDDVFAVLRDWRDDRKIEKSIGGDRLSRIQVVYHDKRGKGAKGEYTLSEIGNWGLAISRAVERVGVRDERLGSLISRYGDGSESVSEVDSLIVWFSAVTAKELKIAQRERAQAKASKS